jgi:hypothetical protein
MKPKLTYANVMSTIAVGLALAGGVAYAVTAPKNSVRSKSIVDGQVAARDLASLRVVVDQRSILDAELPDGARAFGSAEARCKKKEMLLSGGGELSGGSAGGGNAQITQSAPLGRRNGPRSWSVAGDIDGGPGLVTAFAVCISAKP